MRTPPGLNRRSFIKSGLAAAAALPEIIHGAPRAGVTGGDRARLGAYYLNANMYTAVPRHVRADMEWMADKGTRFVCIGILEQDLWAAHENIALIVAEASRVGMQPLAVPSRWGGLTAGAPKVPSMFSVLNPHTWMVNKNGISGFAPKVSGVISSVHWPETYEFFINTLSELYRQHPLLAGLILDEPKGFHVDYSAKAIEVLGKDAPRIAHMQAAAAFYDRVCAFAKQKYPDKMTLLFTQVNNAGDEIDLCVSMRHLDYFGGDGRPWDLAADAMWKDRISGQESGKGKVLLSGKGKRFVDLAHSRGKKSFFLIENHNLSVDMIPAMDRHYPEVLALGADLYLYYYYPRNVQEPDHAMDIIGRHLRNFSRA